MKSLFFFFIKTLPFALGVVLVLTSLTFLVEFVDYVDFENEDFWLFVFFAIIGIPTLLYGINKASNGKL
jgi:hypothetical protein